MMGIIHVLTQSLVNKIAAGEVIERPASVVKELVENALDAGADHVRVEVEDGGKKLIRVIDNGSGIHPADMAKLFTSHATSKLSTDDDLFRIATFGFRGEALASVGAVAHVSIASRVHPVRSSPDVKSDTAHSKSHPQFPETSSARGGSAVGGNEAGEASTGFEVRVENGQRREPKPIGCPEGTTITVHNLFATIPARRKFLRATDIEYGHIQENLLRFAVAHPAVRFELHHNGMLDLSLDRAPDLMTRIGHFFGKDFQEALIPVASDVPPHRFRAYLAPPRFSRISLKGQFIFLNGRFIRDRVLSRAITEAFREMIPHGRYPSVFLFLDVPPSEVDVNVHPTKIEVRFRSVWRLHDQLLEAMRNKLIETEITPTLSPGVFRNPGPQDAPYKNDTSYQAIVDFFTRPAVSPSGAPMAVIDSSEPLLTTGRRFFQVHDMFLVQEVEDGLVIIDQHALHERFMYEEIKKQYAADDLVKQRLLTPMTLTLNRDERFVLEDNRVLLESLGIEFDDFGQDSIALRAAPAILGDTDPVTLVKDFIEVASEKGESGLGEGETMMDRALHFMACHAAVKAGMRLSEQELSKLLSMRETLEYAQTCVHGRPTSVKLTLEDLEKLFKRR